MIPVIIYEALPAMYLILGISLLSFAELPMLLFSACLFYFAGAAIWIMRSAYRRTDEASIPRKKWIQPDLLYEFMPFLQLFSGTAMIRCFMVPLVLPGFLLVFLAIKHLLQRHTNRKCIAPILA